MPPSTANDFCPGTVKIDSDGYTRQNIFMPSGWTLEVQDLNVLGTFTFGDAALDTLILKGRISTMTAAGAVIPLGATYTYSELMELRCQVTSWTGIGSAFKGYYFRAENAVAGSGKGLRAAEFYAVTNATFGIDNLQGIYAEAAMKASGTQTIANANAIEAALAPYGGTGAITITNHWECLLLTPSGTSSRIDSGNAAKIHGVYLLARDGDGGSTKLGDGFYMGNDSSQSGTRTLTNGINIAIGCTNGITMNGAIGTGLAISGTCSGSSISLSGTKAIGLEMAGTYSGHMIYLHPTTLSTGKRALRIGDYGTEVEMAGGDGLIRTYGKVTSGTSISALEFNWGFTTCTASIIGQQMQIESHAATPGPTTVMVADFIAGLDAGHYLATSPAVTDGMFGARCKVYADVSSVCNGNVAALWLDSQMCCAVGGIEASILATTGGTVPDAFVRFQTNSSGWANLLYFDSLMAPVSASATALNGITTSHKIAVYISGVGTVYIPVVTSGMA